MNLGQRKIHLWRAALDLALSDRDLDAAGSLAAALSQKNTLDVEFPQGGRDFSLGVVARLKGDETAAHAAFRGRAHNRRKRYAVHPDNVDLLSDLGLIDAALGKKKRR